MEVASHIFNKWLISGGEQKVFEMYFSLTIFELFFY